MERAGLPQRLRNLADASAAPADEALCHVHGSCRRRCSDSALSSRQRVADRRACYVEDAFGRLGYLAFYFAGGLAATMTETAIPLIAGRAADARVPTPGASGAIAAVLGAYLLQYPGSRVLSLIGIIPIKVPAWLLPESLVSRPARRGQLRPLQHQGHWRWSRLLRPRRRLHRDPGTHRLRPDLSERHGPRAGMTLVVPRDTGATYPTVVAALIRTSRTRTSLPIGSTRTIRSDAIAIRDAAGPRPEREDGVLARALDATITVFTVGTLALAVLVLNVAGVAG
jgi:hypothetical protein